MTVRTIDSRTTVHQIYLDSRIWDFQTCHDYFQFAFVLAKFDSDLDKNSNETKNGSMVRDIDFFHPRNIDHLY